MALEQLDPAPAGDALFGVPSPFVGGHLVPRATVLFDYAHRPLVVGDEASGGVVVGGQGFLHIGASLALWDRLLVSANLPVALVQGGDSPTYQGVAFPSPEGAAIGDLRLGGRLRLFGGDQDPFQIAGGFSLHLPTGAQGVYVGEGAVRLGPQVLLGGRVNRFVWSAAVGAMFRPSQNPSMLTYGAGAAYVFGEERLQIGAELFAATALQNTYLELGKNKTFSRDIDTNAEVLVDVKARVWKSLWVGAAGGPGLSGAIGTPVFRVLGALTWAPSSARDESEGGAGDTDGDGLLDAQDACPYAYGPKSADPKKNGCPVVDDDEDGIPNEADACPDKAGKASEEPKKNGCPPMLDTDGDGVPDEVDACPDKAGPAGSKTPGCPEGAAGQSPDVADTDGDGIVDAKDACPGEKGAANSEASANGCPKWVRVKEGTISLLEPVRFKISSKDLAPLDPASDPVLTELREVLMAHPEWVKVEVQSHTDDKGDAKFNAMVSTARAEAVKKWLVDHGVPAERLTAKGHGPDKPIADNRTAAGREKNKRIELVVVEKK